MLTQYVVALKNGNCKKCNFILAMTKKNLSI
jgi:hypothetical protein